MNRLLVGLPDKTDFLLQIISEQFPEGVTVIDPTGDFAKAVANILPKHLTQSAVFFDAANQAHPIGLNVLENVPPDDRQRLTEQLCACIDTLFSEGPTTLTRANSNYYLANCLRLLLDDQETLLGVLKLLTDTTLANERAQFCTDPVVKKFWDGVAQWDKKQRATNFAPLLAKIGLLLMSPTIRNIVGQQYTTFDTPSLPSPIVIANLDRAKLGDTTARLLGGLLIARSKGYVVINDYPFFRFPLPLSQERFTVSLAYLDEARELKQQLLSIKEKYVFACTKKDADELLPYTGALNPNMLIDLDATDYRTRSGLFRMARPASLKRLRALKKRTKACHTKTRLAVETDIAATLRGE